MTDKKQGEKKLRIGFIHPDLGIGGAERLVVDAAVSLQRRGHDVVIFTSRHDPKRCFEETRDGTLQVHVLGSSLPMRLHPKLPLTIIFSILRSLLLTVLLLFSLLLPGPASPFNPLSPLQKFDVFIVDQQSVCVPLLRFVSGSRVVFYCHFPDKLLSTGWSIGPDGKSVRETGETLRRIYRWPIDKLEEFTTGQSDVILANSKFTASVYSNAFPSLRKRTPRVVYPCIDIEQYSPSKTSKGKSRADRAVDLISSDRPTLVSLNRFEAKKNVELAIEAFALVVHDKRVPEMRRDSLRLVIAGGYDPQLPENAETLDRLESICQERGLTSSTLSVADLDKDAKVEEPNERCKVLFILNFTNAQRAHLLTSPNTLGLLYTPTNEHFGIVPIEAGACGLPVIATNTGGPLETILDPTTGLLRRPTVQTWAEALESLIMMNPGQRQRMGEEAKKRVHEMFSLEKLGEELETACVDAIKMGDIHTQVGDKLIWGGASFMAAAVVALVLTLWYS